MLLPHYTSQCYRPYITYPLFIACDNLHLSLPFTQIHGKGIKNGGEIKNGNGKVFKVKWMMMWFMLLSFIYSGWNKLQNYWFNSNFIGLKKMLLYYVQKYAMATCWKFENLSSAGGKNHRFFFWYYYIFSLEWLSDMYFYLVSHVHYPKENSC